MVIKGIIFLLFSLFAFDAHALSLPDETCAADGGHANVFNKTTNSWSCVAVSGGGGGMIYPSSGLALSTGTGWGTSVTNNSTNWNTAYGWGNHASAGYLTGNETITISGDASGSGDTSITLTLANSATARTNLGLGSVENTALSTWAGTTNITTLGTIATGEWNGTPIGVSYLPAFTSTTGGIVGASGGGETNFLRADGTWAAPSSGGSMVYPGAGLAVSTGTGWGTSLTDNSANWNTAYGWGNHASAGYALSSSLGTLAAQDADSVAITGGSISGLTALTASGLTLSNITGSTQCLHVNSSGVVSGTGSDCGASGGSGTVNSSSAGYAAYYATATNAVSGTSALTYSATAVNINAALVNTSTWGMKYVAGRMYRGDGMTIGGEASAVKDTMIACPFFVKDSPLKAASVSVHVGTSATSSQVGFAIYDHDSSTNDPVNLVASTATVSTTSTGQKTAVFASPPTLQPGLHWVVMNSNSSSPKLYGQAGWASTVSLFTGAASVSEMFGDGPPVQSITASRTYGTWPSTFGTGALSFNVCPVMALTATN